MPLKNRALSDDAIVVQKIGVPPFDLLAEKQDVLDALYHYNRKMHQGVTRWKENMPPES
jgi:hypothetical protein